MGQRPWDRSLLILWPVSWPVSVIVFLRFEIYLLFGAWYLGFIPYPTPSLDAIAQYTCKI
jgi:hypothetical protein